MADTTDLQQKWNSLYRERLPKLAKARDAAQSKWPVVLDHCFARIILDNAVGKTSSWDKVVKAPATKNMTRDQLEAALDLGEKICAGDVDLVELDRNSLDLRGKSKHGSSKRKAEDANRDREADKRPKTEKGDDSETDAARAKATAAQDGESQKQKMAGVWEAFSAAKKARTSPAEESEELCKIREIIKHDQAMSDFRKLVLCMLTQVPRGRFSTYKAMADAIPRLSKTSTGSARSIGGAMRNNPFAPTVPCHRIIAADGRLGGFGGDWGEEGRFAKSKKQMLRDEGVGFDGKGKVIGKPFTDFKPVE